MFKRQTVFGSLQVVICFHFRNQIIFGSSLCYHFTVLFSKSYIRETGLDQCLIILPTLCYSCAHSQADEAAALTTDELRAAAVAPPPPAKRTEWRFRDHHLRYVPFRPVGRAKMGGHVCRGIMLNTISCQPDSGRVSATCLTPTDQGSKSKLTFFQDSHHIFRFDFLH